MIELLAPAGSYESLRAAVNAGADAVYMGGTRFGARAYADNPEQDKFIDGLRYAHRYGAKVYMTVNTLFKPREIDELIDYLTPYYEAGLDAAIVQDLGAAKIIREHFPDLPLHASTQMTIANTYGAQLLKENGFRRVVPARELSLSEVQSIASMSGLEVETFVHGALCYCYSGQCLMSSLIGGRSGNRGRCAQPCRLPYTINDEELALLSPRDLCCIELLPRLAEAGIHSFKIEGRMKSPRYTAGVTAVWRKYLDLWETKGSDAYRVDPADRQMLSDLYNRGDFTDGYYFRHNGPDMMAWEERNRRNDPEELYADLDERYVHAVRKLKIHGEAVIRHDRKLQMLAKADGYRPVAVTGEKPDLAVKRAMTEEEIRKQLEKTGNTPFVFADLAVDTDGESFVPMGALNEMRRKVLEALEEEMWNESTRSGS